jgi:hypothetical protein
VRIKRDDQGSVAVVVAVAMLFLAVPLLWLVVDGGGMYAEHRQLQNAADAGVLAAAQACSEKTNPADCTAGFLFSKAQPLVDDNDFFDSTDGRNEGVTFEQGSWYICGSAVAGQPCAAGDVAGELQTFGVSDCPAEEPSGQYIQVRVVSGGEGWKGLVGQTTTQVFACARARVSGPEEIVTLIPGTPQWVETMPVPATSPSTEINVTPAQNPSSANVVALTISLCEWKSATNNGANYSGSDTWIEFNPPDASCVPSGQIAPGSFGGLSEAKPSGAGTQSVSLGDTVPTGTGDPSNWKAIGQILLANTNKTWLIPLYDSSTKSGNNVKYHIVGFAAFNVRGFYLSNATGMRDPGRADTHLETLYGHFVGGVICSGSVYVCSGSGGGNYGVYVPAATSTTIHPGTPASSYYITHSAVPDTSETTTVPGNPASAKPVL